MDSPIAQAVKAAGGITQLARQIKVTAPTVHQWLNGDRPIPPARCIPIERATKDVVTRYDLRPDVFGKKPSASKESAAA